MASFCLACGKQLNFYDMKCKCDYEKLEKRIKTLEDAMREFILDSCHFNALGQGMPKYKANYYQDQFKQLLNQ